MVEPLAVFPTKCFIFCNLYHKQSVLFNFEAKVVSLSSKYFKSISLAPHFPSESSICQNIHDVCTQSNGFKVELHLKLKLSVCGQSLNFSVSQTIASECLYFSHQCWLFQNSTQNMLNVEVVSPKMYCKRCQFTLHYNCGALPHSIVLHRNFTALRCCMKVKFQLEMWWLVAENKWYIRTTMQLQRSTNRP